MRFSLREGKSACTDLTESARIIFVHEEKK